jgi:hypothetical protein
MIDSRMTVCISVKFESSHQACFECETIDSSLFAITAGERPTAAAGTHAH